MPDDEEGQAAIDNERPGTGRTHHRSKEAEPRESRGGGGGGGGYNRGGNGGGGGYNKRY